jgi:hypothetical protein
MLRRQTEHIVEVVGHKDLRRAVRAVVPDLHVLVPRGPLENGTAVVEAVAIRSDEARHHGFTESPRGFDPPLVRTVERVAGEEHAGGERLDEPLNDHTDSRFAAQPLAPAIR